MSALTTCSATELARRIHNREVSAVEVLEAHLDRISQVNPDLNAIVTLTAESARARAEAADAALASDQLWGPLHGVPMTVKDQFSTGGVRTTYGLPHYGRFVPETDAPVLRQLREAGAILMGKTNLPFASYDWQCLHPQFGRTQNPWDPARTCGGSSGGAAAALAAGLTPLELGADVGGSIRVPSHFCGVAGLRPTEGRLPLEGITPPDNTRTVHHMVVPGPMARTVEDLQLAWQCLSPDTTDVPTTPFSDIRNLRIAVTPELGSVPVDTDTQSTLRRTVSSLRTAGCTVASQPAPIDVDEAVETWANIQGFELSASVPGPLRVAPLKQLLWYGAVQAQFGFLGRLLAQGAHSSSRDYFAALERKDQLVRSVDRFLTEWDLWLTPATSIPAFTHRPTGRPLHIEGVSVPYALPFATYTCAMAVPGHPILTLPAGHSAKGLPIGLQVHARQGRDGALLAAGHSLEAVLSDTPSTPLDP